MTKQQKIILFGAIGVFLCLVALIIVLIVKNAEKSSDVSNDMLLAMQEEADSLRRQNDSLELANLTSEFNRLNAEFEQFDDKELNIKNDSLVRKYNEAKARVDKLIKELDQEKKSNRVNQAKIKQLESEITTLKGIARHYLEEINRLNQENEGLRKEIATEKTRNESLARENATVSRDNAQLSQTVQLAKKLNIASLSLRAYDKKDKNEKNITKAKKLGVSFSVTPNNTAAPGMKTFYVRIVTPEGSVLPGGPSFSYDGASVASTASRQLEYANQELPVNIYWTVNSTLTPGTYTVEVFCDGYRLGSGKFNMTK